MGRLNILWWPGGKDKLAKTIISYFPVHEIYVEPFGGAAHVLLQKEPSKIEVYNDINGDLVNLFKVARDRTEELIEFLEMTPYSRQIYKEVTTLYFDRSKWDELDELQRAAYFFIIVNMSFAGKAGRGWAYEKVNKNIPQTYFNKVYRIREFVRRFRSVYIENDDFENIIKRWDSEETLFYCDPPYYKAEEYYEANAFSEADHHRLAHVLKDIKGMFILSYNDCVWVREIYADFNIYELTRANSMFYRNGDSMRPEYNEVIITNFEVGKTKFAGGGTNNLIKMLGGGVE